MMMMRQRPTDGPQRGLLHERARLRDLDRQPLGGDDLDVGVGAVERGAALDALAAPTVAGTAERRRRPGPRSSGRSRAGR